MALAVAIAAACTPEEPDEPSPATDDQPSSESGDRQEEEEPSVDEAALLLEFGELLAQVALTGGDALERTLAVSAGNSFDPQCAPLWAHELLETIDDGQVAVEVAPGGISVQAVLVPAEVQHARAVHLGGECDGRLPQPRRPSDDNPSDPPSSSESVNPPVEAQPSPEPQPDQEPDQIPTDENEADESSVGEPEPQAPPPPAVAPPPEPQTRDPVAPANVDARGNQLPDGMILPEAYEVTYTCEWWLDGTIFYTWSIHLRGGRQYQFAAHAVGQGDFEWRYWSSPRDGKRIDAQGGDNKATTRDALLFPEPAQLRFFHRTSGIPDSSTDYWLDISHLQGSLDYQRLTCSGVDPR